MRLTSLGTFAAVPSRERNTASLPFMGDEATFLEPDRGGFGAHSTAADAGIVAARARFTGVVEIARELERYVV